MRDFPINTRSEITTQLLKKFLESRSESALMNEYYVDEVGLTPGSFGKKHYIYSLLPKNPDSRADAILLDIKEVYTEKNNRFFYSPFDHHGLRMIEASKIFADGMEERLGYCTHQGKQYSLCDGSRSEIGSHCIRKKSSRLRGIHKFRFLF